MEDELIDMIKKIKIDEKKMIIDKIREKIPNTIVNDDWTLLELYQRLEAIISIPLGVIY